ncbi:MAG: arylsulfotransferase family protein [Sphingobium sp.]
MSDKNKRPKAGPMGWLFAIDWAMVAFVFSLCGIAFAYGVATMKLKIFPYHVIENAKAAVASLSGIEDEDVMISLNKMDEKAKPVPIVKTLDPTAGSELLLVTRGPNQDAKNCPQFGCLAQIINRRGDILHSWPLPLDGLFSDVKGFTGNTQVHNFYPVGLQLMLDGSLIATFHGRNMYPYTVGIARISRDGKIMWKHIDHAHHWFVTGADGRTFAPVQIDTKMEYFGDSDVDVRCKTPVYDEGIRVYRADGTVEKTLLVIKALSEGGYHGLLYGLRDDCDPIHINSVDLVTPEIAAKLPGVDAGDLLVSLREPSTIAIMDKDDGHVKMLETGRTAAQHSAHFLPDGTVVAFDNRGGSKKTGGSRIARINLMTGEAQTVFPGANAQAIAPFYSTDGGHIMVSPDGKRIMISSKDESRDIEIDAATGKPLWTMTHISDVGPFLDGDGKDVKPVAAWFKSYGTYYVTAEQARGLKLGGAGRSAH